MSVLVDTSVWSLALRRENAESSPQVLELDRLIRLNLVRMIGPVRQEILCGIRNASRFERLADDLCQFPDIPSRSEDFTTAARFYNRCRGRGIQGSHIDFLICAVAWSNDLSIFATDRDFENYCRILPIRLHRIGSDS